MNDSKNQEFRSDLISVGERLRDICAARVPANLGRYTGSQLRMINRIYELTRQCPEGIQLKKLAQVLKITPAATSEMVETLVKRGALERRVSPSDRRAMALRLAPELEDLFQMSVNHLDSHLQRFFAGLTDGEAAVASSVIHKLNIFLSAAVQQEKEQ
ncbi:MAG: MarR family transcriptional regulator [Lentisphaerae bacterium]|nr:MarR family transcriptional regulator [Lentisphaerota bacterium]